MTATQYVEALSAEEEALTYCFGCGNTRVVSDMVGDLCVVCLSPDDDTAARDEEIRHAEQTVINRRALVLLVKHHREEFEALVTSEREKYEAGK